MPALATSIAPASIDPPATSRPAPAAGARRSSVTSASASATGRCGRCATGRPPTSARRSRRRSCVGRAPPAFRVVEDQGERVGEASRVAGLEVHALKALLLDHVDEVADARQDGGAPVLPRLVQHAGASRRGRVGEGDDGCREEEGRDLLLGDVARHLDVRDVGVPLRGFGHVARRVRAVGAGEHEPQVVVSAGEQDAVGLDQQVDRLVRPPLAERHDGPTPRRDAEGGLGDLLEAAVRGEQRVRRAVAVAQELDVPRDRERDDVGAQQRAGEDPAREGHELRGEGGPGEARVLHVDVVGQVVEDHQRRHAPGAQQRGEEQPERAGHPLVAERRELQVEDHGVRSGAGDGSGDARNRAHVVERPARFERHAVEGRGLSGIRFVPIDDDVADLFESAEVADQVIAVFVEAVPAGRERRDDADAQAQSPIERPCSLLRHHGFPHRVRMTVLVWRAPLSPSRSPRQAILLTS